MPLGTDDPEINKRVNVAFLAALGFLAIAFPLLGLPGTRAHARAVLYDENSPVEILTFLLLVVASISGFALAARARRMRLGTLTTAFYVVYSLGLAFIAIEEISWGQWFFFWETPPTWAEANIQGETNLHNHEAVQPFVHAMHVLFGVGGLVGIWAVRVGALRWVATPPVLAPWFALIAVHATAELIITALFFNTFAYKAVNRTAELMELYLSAAAWLYVFLNARRLSRSADALGARAVRAGPVEAETRPS
jgi:hypothetical protein